MSDLVSQYMDEYHDAFPAGHATALEVLDAYYRAAEQNVIEDPETGGRKGTKLARFDMVPPDVLWELAEHYGKGEAKYESDETGLPNWQRGYSWRLSSAALMRHLFLWLSGEDFDKETGSSHLVCVMWHCIALRWFQLHGKGQDYR